MVGRRLRRGLLTASLASWLPCLIPGAVRAVRDRDGVLLTFDDGPSPETTERLLDDLDEAGCTAVHFLVAEHAGRYPSLTRRIVERGHVVGCHGLVHRRMIGSVNHLATELLRAKELLEEISGVEIHYFRPPYGWWLPHQNPAVTRAGMQLMLWSRMPFDFLPHATVPDILSFLDAELRGGDILVLHDDCHAPSDMSVMLRGISEILHRRALHAVQASSLVKG